MSDEQRREEADGTFLPCTREVAIGRGVVYRPIRSWHSGTFAGEKRRKVGGDASGCVEVTHDQFGERVRPYSCPQSAMHRVYWNVRKPDERISAFLSYPNGMNACDEYNWEADIGGDGPERFTGAHAESEMEAAILAEIGDELQSGEPSHSARNVAMAGTALILSTPGLTAEALDAYTDVVRREMRAGARSSEPSRDPAAEMVARDGSQKGIASLAQDILDACDSPAPHRIRHIREAAVQIKRRCT